jgi:psp operon transcriptional activator
MTAKNLPTPDLVEALGQSDLFLQFQQDIAKVVPVRRPVLLIGERGTGKELAAARIHFLSPRWSGPFLKLNCASLSPDLLETELFGHEAGAFTGAIRQRIGRFEAASGGTLFLDEIAQMPTSLQEKILRVVEYGSFERVGDSTTITVEVRLVGATNANLMELADQGKFKRDLLDRLSFEVLLVPPLRIRRGDIELLANHFASQMALEIGLAKTPRFSARALQTLRNYGWPGNVRELRNVVERAVYRAEGPEIDEIDLDPFKPPFSASLEQLGKSALSGPEQALDISTTAVTEHRPPERPLSFNDAVARFECDLLRKALQSSRYNQSKAAAQLDMTYDQFRGLYRKYRTALETESGVRVASDGPGRAGAPTLQTMYQRPGRVRAPARPGPNACLSPPTENR